MEKKKLIVTGCNGQLGRAINKELGKNLDYEFVNTDVAELDITNIDKVMELARQVQPYAIINCAAHTAVDKCETQKDSAFRINALGPRNLSIAANETGAKMIHISTDYVFDGEQPTPYYETDMPHPQSVYGSTKLAGEQFVSQFAKRSFILRTAWLYGEGNNFAKTMLRLSETNDQVTVVSDQYGSPTSAGELAAAIAVLLPTENYGLFHATCEGSCSWADFAREVFRLAGKKTIVKDVTTEEYLAMYPAQAKRPHYSILENYMFKMTTDYSFADWKQAVECYIRTL